MTLDMRLLQRVADWLAVAVVVSLPWSTSVSVILIVLWLLAVLPTLTEFEVFSAYLMRTYLTVISCMAGAGAGASRGSMRTTYKSPVVSPCVGGAISTGR